MNLKKGKFKIVEGTRVRMVSSKDTHIVEGAYGTVVSPGIRESEVRWDSMLAIRADYRYRNELEDALIIPVYNDLLDPSGNFQIWTPEPIARIYLDAVRTTVLRAIKTEFSNYATAKNAKPLDNAAEVAIIKKLRDQRIDNAEQYRMAGRQDLYDNEMAESLILNEFLPEVPDDKVLALGLVEVCALQGCEDGPKIPKSKMGIIIKELKAMFPAADGKQIADLVKSCVV